MPDISGEQLSWTQLLDVAGGVGASGLVIVIVIMILRGGLVPGREMRYWREAFFEEQRQKRDLIEAGRVTRDLLAALPPDREPGS